MNPSAAAFAGLLLVTGGLAAALLFALARAHPRHAAGGVVALAVYLLAVVGERYGAPLALLLWTERAAQRQFGASPIDARQAVAMVLGWRAPEPAWPLVLAGAVAVAAGIAMLLLARRTLAAARRTGRLATDGIYAWTRHPEYAACLAIALGALLLWPGWLAVALAPLLAALLWRYARDEEADLLAAHGDAWRRYAGATPRLVPRPPARRSEPHAP